MATVAISSYDTISRRPRGFIVNFATTMGNGDVTAPLQLGGPVAQLNVELRGTIGGATFVVQGSVDNTNWSTLHDITGTAISVTTLTANLYETILECNAPYIRAQTSGGSTTALTVTFSGSYAAPA